MAESAGFPRLDRVRCGGKGLSNENTRLQPGRAASHWCAPLNADIFGKQCMFRFKCQTCREIHEGMPTFGWDHPLLYLTVPESERAARCTLTSDTCVIDGDKFFVRGCVEIPVLGESESFAWGAWVSLSDRNFAHFLELLDTPSRSNHGPFFGWLSSAISVYPDTMNLKTTVHLRDDGIRPFIELEPTDHPLAIEQRSGIDLDRVAEIYATVVHRES